ncbi:arrestin domain-containing protein 3-like [Biomphalaria glabrata]|uniref:Arrestin domain-containing protein 3-like n=1 Tax=Biomphalaria glabrata TaxID=6526 RepID=A0A9U8EAS8_BIOGL|nr:arrestin domain-containing protein 3-like [Biomphalaria glabrata]XP_013079204.2 arrestin domain-containing protein 3-like [Biomphalaria glabrata]XP_013079205.2 arrestin domain-containing protein 3-like [Biomphalaria glabrata]XP_055874379.1 arrestin domain-containing protein 3-like [Biomphalaria glabrata]KAI8777174.1 arrestin domain-containing protein 3 isoform X1 [Biomphalaria glabrata]
MRPKVFEIVLTNNEAVFYSGQTLQGHVILELDKNVKVSGIKLVFHGKAFVHWTEQVMRGPGESRFKEVRHHSATEDYIDVTLPLLSKSNQQDEERTLESGQYTYPFQFHIPASSPSSFEGQYGFIRYWIKVAIERPWKEDVSVKKLFTVIYPVDLNREPTADQPIHNKREKRLCCLCCVSGPISASLSLSHKGYVPGETLYVNAEISNHSKRKVGSTSVELLMTTTFHTPIKSRSVTQQVASIQHGSLRHGDNDTWEGDPLVLPPVPPSYMIGCGIIDVRYTLELRVFPVGPAFELSVPLEILIGTVPLNSTIDRYLAMHQMTPPTPRNLNFNHRGASAIQDNDIRPSYLSPNFSSSSVCRHHLHDDDDDHSTTFENNYTPYFVVYNFQVVPPRRQHAVSFATLQ